MCIYPLWLLAIGVGIFVMLDYQNTRGSVGEYRNTGLQERN